METIRCSNRMEAGECQGLARCGVVQCTQVLSLETPYIGVVKVHLPELSSAYITHYEEP